MINKDRLKNICADIGVDLDAQALERFELFASLLVEKNKVLNLTAITDPEGIAVKHFADSLTALRMIELNEGDRVIDVGTGGGFPGIPLLIARPEIELTMLDSTGKKLAFVSQSVEELGLSANVVHARAEEAGRVFGAPVLGVASVFVCLMVASSGILQAYGREKLPVWTLLAGGAVKIAASIALVSRLDIGIHGAPISTLLCYGLIAALNLGAIRRSIPAQVRLGEIFGKPLVMTAVMAVTARALYGLLSRAAGNGVAVLGAIALAALVYGVLAVALGAVRREDLLALPKGEKIADKLHLR